jgi:hypothetical protein
VELLVGVLAHYHLCCVFSNGQVMEVSQSK